MVCDVLTASGEQVPEDSRLHNHWKHRAICTADVTCSRHTTGGLVRCRWVDGGQAGQWDQVFQWGASRSVGGGGADT